MAAELSEQERRRTYRAVFTTPEGEWIMRDLRAQFFQRSGLTADNDPHAALAAAAQRAMYLWIEQMVEGPVDGGVRSDSEFEPERG